jgi:hypothetical protein
MTPERKTLSRRSLLCGAAGTALLPFVPVLQSDAASSEGPEKRMILLYSPNGTVISKWRPSSGSEHDFVLGEVLAPLEPHRDRLLVLDGLDDQANYDSPVGGHTTNMTLWTGSPCVEGNAVNVNGAPMGWPGGPSVDQFIADALEGTTPFRSLELAAHMDYTTWAQQMWYRGANDPIPARTNPREVFDLLFGAAGLSPAELERLRAAKLSVIDTVKPQLEALHAELGGLDRQLLDRHLTAVRSIEQRVENTPGYGGCSIPDPAPDVPYENDAFPERSDLMLDLMVSALACDLTRVASLMWSHEGGYGVTFSWLGHTEHHHYWTHPDGGSNQAPDPTPLVEISNWYALQFKALLDRLAAIPDGGGTLLDNTVVVWGSGLSNGWNHSRRNCPIVLAGECGGYFDTGRYLRWGTWEESFDQSGANPQYGTKPINDLLISLCHAMDVPVDTFGAPEYCTGPLEGLT